MKSTLTRIAAAAALAACAIGAHAQAPAPAAPGAQPPGMHMQHDRAQMQERMQQHRQERFARRMESFKRILQVTPQQEGAWAAYTAAMKPAPHARRERGEFARMSTPQRIDAMKQMRAQRAAEQDRRGDATKTFYAQLSPSQQKAFDEISLKMMRGGHRGMHRGHHG
jgi:hypothetical protein